MDLRDLVKLAGIVTPELLNKLEPTAEVEEADGAGFDQATTRPEPEMMDDPMATMGSDADLSLRRYLKAKGDHVTVDEADLYPDYTVEDVNEAYAAFKEGKYKSDAQRKAVHAAKAEESIEEGKLSDQIIHDSETMSKEDFAKKYGKEMADEYFEATIGAPDYNPAAGKYASNTVERVVLGAEEGGIIVSVDGKPIGWAPTPEELADMLKSAGVDDNTDIMASSSVDFASEEEFENDDAAHEFIQNALEIMGIEESAKLATNEGRMKDMYTELEDLEPAIMRLKTKYMDQGMEPEEAQDEACEMLGCDPEMFDEYLTMKFDESTLDEADIDENAFNQAAAAAARANKDEFEFNGKTYKTKMDKSTAHKLDDDVDMLRKLAGL
jgi:hypothetical protein